jgi:hypothetical protein
VYDARTKKEAFALKGPTALTAPVFSPDGARLAASGADGAVWLYDARTGQEVLALKGPVRLTAPVFSPDGARLAALGADGVVRVWAAPTDVTAWQAERCQALVLGLPAWHRARADESERSGDWYATAFHLQLLSDIDPVEPRYLFRRAIALIRLGKVDESRKLMDKAVQVAEKNPPADKTRQLQLQDLRHQAEALLKEPPPDPKK